MEIYKPLIADNYQFFETKSLEILDILNNRDYKHIEDDSFSLCSLNRKLLGDITIIDSSMLLAFSNQAKQSFSKSGNFISLKGLNNYELFEAPILDALDYQNSQIDYFSGTQQIKRIRKYSFITSMLNKVELFQLPIKGTPVFVTDIFIDKFKTNGYNGLDFSIVFSN